MQNSLTLCRRLRHLSFTTITEISNELKNVKNFEVEDFEINILKFTDFLQLRTYKHYRNDTEHGTVHQLDEIKVRES